MTTPELTLNKVKEKAETKTFRASDFLTDEEKTERVKAKANARRAERLYTAVDSYIAEIIARFGYEAYRAWLKGEISEDKMYRLVLAERSREKRYLFPLENLIVASVAGANQPTKNGRTPKSLRVAIKMLKEEQEKANG